LPALSNFLAVDLGAESGRVLLGNFDGERASLKEVHRFPNGPVSLPDGLYWDILGLFTEIRRGLAKALGDSQGPESLGVDSWAVDFALLDRTGALLSNPRHYRDPRTDGVMERAFERVSRTEIYRTTGIQLLQINTLFQLLSMREQDSPLLEAAEHLLLVPDLLGYWLTGEKSCEFTNATTTQLCDRGGGTWARDLVVKMGLPSQILPPLISPGTDLGPLTPRVAADLGATGDLRVVAVASHDTASAVAAVPARGSNFAYVSSGTWSLVGLETPDPIVTQEALEANFTNEGGVGGRTRFLKNVMGLWLLQECRRHWAKRVKEYSYGELESLARRAPAFGPLVDPDNQAFLSPGDMPARIRSFCAETGQEPPREPGEYARCVFESLALRYRRVIAQAEGLSGQRVDVVHIVGGGARNALLCQLTADATGLPVVAGPVEATAMGNVMVQALARGRVGSLEEIRAVVRNSVEPRVYEPHDGSGWAEVQERFGGVLDASPTVAERRGA